MGNLFTNQYSPVCKELSVWIQRELPNNGRLSQVWKLLCNVFSMFLILKMVKEPQKAWRTHLVMIVRPRGDVEPWRPGAHCISSFSYTDVILSSPSDSGQKRIPISQILVLWFHAPYAALLICSAHYKDDTRFTVNLLLYPVSLLLSQKPKCWWQSSSCGRLTPSMCSLFLTCIAVQFELCLNLPICIELSQFCPHASMNIMQLVNSNQLGELDLSTAIIFHLFWLLHLHLSFIRFE